MEITCPCFLTSFLSFQQMNDVVLKAIFSFLSVNFSLKHNFCIRGQGTEKNIHKGVK